MNRMSIGNLPKKDYYVQTEIDRLRVNLGFVGADKKVILITSNTPDEGKSYISVSLWAELAKAGKRVCYVDSDMRKSVLRNTLQMRTDTKEFMGLSHYLAGNCEMEDIVYLTDITDQDNAYLIPTTTLINPSILLEGDRFSTLIDSLRRSFDYVIVDTPPMTLVSDAQFMSDKCDGCILVVRAHETSRYLVRNSVMQLRQSGCPLLGVVLNRLKADRQRYYGRYGGKYYGKYYYGRYYGKREGEEKTGAEAEQTADAT